MLLDFENLSSSQKLEVDEISTELKIEFENLIKTIGDKNKNNKDFFFSNIISRNNDENRLFYNLCLIELSQRLCNENKIEKIITSNLDQEKILKQKLKNIKITTHGKKKKNFVKNLYKFLKNIGYLLQLKFCKNDKRKEKFKNLKKISLLETFFIPKMFSNNSYQDRYYENLLNKIDYAEKKNIVFFPIFFQKAIKKKFINLAEKNVNIILQSDFLKISDYVKSICYFLRIKKINLKNLIFRGFKIDHLVRSELLERRFNQSSMIALLNYYCFKRMKEEKIDIHLVIDWFENQIVDKGLNYGKNIFFPEIKSKGFIGLNSIFEINDNFIPSPYEIENKLVPREICITNPKYYELFKKKRKDIDLSAAPSIRSTYLFEKINFLNKGTFDSKLTKILINFTASVEDNIEMINLINECGILRSKSIDLLIRPHQESNKKIFKRFISKKIDYKISNLSFYEEMKNIDILISRSSTACFESLIFGAPVIITRRKNSFLPNKIHETFPKNFWFFSNDHLQLEKNIHQIIIDKNKYLSKNIDERKKLLFEYFYPVDKSNISLFLK